MPIKDAMLRKKYHAQYMRDVWYPKNKKKHIGYVKRNKEAVSAFIEKFKRAGKCADCGYAGTRHPYVLDFDHEDGGMTKEFTIGSWRRSVLSIETLKHEMQKCELVCANCHRIRTFSKKRKSR